MQSLVLEMQEISKAFPGTQALKNVSIDLYEGEVLALLGENGAGKSTLMKILYGAYQKDHGRVILRGKEVNFQSPHDALQAGIAMIPQEINLAPHLTATENIFLGEEVKGQVPGIVDWSAMRRKAKELLGSLGVSVDVNVPVGRLSTAIQQMVAIAKALYVKAQIIIMDEPTSSLTDSEIEHLFGVIRSLKQQGVSIIYISHRLHEIPKIADRVTVLKDGALVGTLPIEQCDEDKMVLMMVGRPLESKFPAVESPKGEEIFRVENLSRGKKFQNVNLGVRRGEILGIFGLVGAGRTEVARAIFGLDPKDSGRVFIEGKEVTIRDPMDAIAAGIGFVTEDRKKGLLLKQDVMNNIVIAAIPKMCRLGFIDLAQARNLAQEYREALRIKTPSLSQKIVNLSGGNQQKIALAKWFCTHSKVIIFDEPTRGIDVQAKFEVYEHMKRFVENGGAAIMISSELPEILGMSHRILVMHEGEVMGELPRSQATEENIMMLASGKRIAFKEAV
ncbi:MAG: sugar ABC transporter ATP-binding protein [Clostridia bacterium]|nr:sugar ABC transporter ATP-binding protein [Clostridia bacterium]